jgi:hypothetical protein
MWRWKCSARLVFCIFRTCVAFYTMPKCKKFLARFGVAVDCKHFFRAQWMKGIVARRKGNEELAKQRHWQKAQALQIQKWMSWSQNGNLTCWNRRRKQGKAQDVLKQDKMFSLDFSRKQNSYIETICGTLYYLRNYARLWESWYCNGNSSKTTVYG